MRNNIPKSFYEIEKKDFAVYFNDLILNANALIVDYEDIKDVFNNFSIYQARFDLLKEKGMQIYIKLDTLNLKKSYKEIMKVDANYISGFALTHVSKGLLNKMTIRARHFEHINNLNFGTLSFIVYIDSPEAIINYRKIANYDRVYALYIDREGYFAYLGLDNPKKDSLLEDIFIASTLSRKPVIDSYYENDENLNNDLLQAKQYGAISKLTKKLSQLSIINNFFTPSIDEVTTAKEVWLTFQKTKKRKIKHLEYKIIRSRIILSRANELENDYKMIVQNECIKDFNKIKKIKKFYTFGEEIANAITHCIGIILSLTFLILLLIKGKGEGFYTNFAYVIYALSAFTLYMSSTLYHGLQLGSPAKYLFHKFDRMSIYLLIAGTYTPLTLISIGGDVGFILFIILWVGSAIGIFFNFYKFGKLQWLHMFLYVFLGWIAIFYIKTIIASLGAIPSLLVLLGGIAYTLGIIFYSTKLFKFTHMVWHLFTILGTILHFLAIYLS